MRRFDAKLGDFLENRESWQVYIRVNIIKKDSTVGIAVSKLRATVNVTIQILFICIFDPESSISLYFVHEWTPPWVINCTSLLLGNYLIKTVTWRKGECPVENSMVGLKRHRSWRLVCT